MRARTLQRIVLLGALVWALLPTWGSLAFTTALVLLAVGCMSRVRAARAVVDRYEAFLSKGLSAEGRAWVRRFALSYLWPDTAKAWAVAWRQAGLLAFLLMPWFTIRAVFLKERWELLLVLPLIVTVVVALAIARRLDVVELVTKPSWVAFKPQHDEAAAQLALRTMAGQWPPVPSPEAPPPAPRVA